MTDLPMADRPEVVLPDVDPGLRAALEAALAAPGEDVRAEVAAVVATDPTFLDGWARLAQAARDDVERYACARVGYHRGLDALRRNGWGGIGRVRWSHPTNRGFLRCVAVLRDAARAIGEDHEVERLDEFLADLDPDWDDTLTTD